MVITQVDGAKKQATRYAWTPVLTAREGRRQKKKIIWASASVIMAK
jgi:hypothetical protein